MTSPISKPFKGDFIPFYVDPGNSILSDGHLVKIIFVKSDLNQFPKI